MQGIPSPVVSTLMEEAISVCTRTLHSLAVPLTQLVKNDGHHSLDLSSNHSTDKHHPVTKSQTVFQHKALKFSRHFNSVEQLSIAPPTFKLSQLVQALKLVSACSTSVFSVIW